MRQSRSQSSGEFWWKFCGFNVGKMEMATWVLKAIKIHTKMQGWPFYYQSINLFVYLYSFPFTKLSFMVASTSCGLPRGWSLARKLSPGLDREACFAAKPLGGREILIFWHVAAQCYRSPVLCRVVQKHMSSYSSDKYTCGTFQKLYMNTCQGHGCIRLIQQHNTSANTGEIAVLPFPAL